MCICSSRHDQLSALLEQGLDGRGQVECAKAVEEECVVVRDAHELLALERQQKQLVELPGRVALAPEGERPHLLEELVGRLSHVRATIGGSGPVCPDPQHR